ncbi:DUF1285 domain-containing protein [Pseudoalteromonas tunicata]|uniref:DUF1285 domain-containing protein n=1 Tax=Pseudoalteromonas tunicata TaxID=314281 RepID=UPI00273F98D6|nr:DUF1285 domain-containing protein [Pseudoalteromonas tunicata]MDP4983291.1 DUF1285 domain-containing protein [Pseudoalteromonas tunicata]
MDLSALSQQLEGAIPPLDTWDPPYCGEIDIVIKADGSWHYLGSPISRLALVKLFAKVLVKEQNNYFLKTPVEKIKIQVDDAPFVIIDWYQSDTDQGTVICCVDNLERTFLLNQAHPLILKPTRAQALPYIQLHHGLLAKINRTTYYQWAEIAQQIGDDFFIESAGILFQLG